MRPIQNKIIRTRVPNWFIGLSVGVFVLAGSAFAEDKPKVEEQKKVTFDDDVAPIFRAKCGTCHNASDRRGGLALDDYATMLEGGASGDVVFGGDLESSYLWLLVNHESEPKMPPNSPKLPDAELSVIKTWIEQGILRNSGSKAKIAEPNPALAKVTVTMERPDGPPPMPAKYLGDPALVPPRANSVTGLAVNPWSPVAAIAGHEQVMLYDLNLMAPLGALAYPEGTPQRVGFSQNGQLLFVGGGRGGQLGKVALFNVASGERIATIGNEYDACIATDLSPDLSLISVGTPKKVVHVYSSATGEQLYELTKHTDWATATKFSPDGVLLATADRAGGLVIWEADTGREFYVLAGHKESINGIAWRSDSNVVATAGDDDIVRLWEMNEGKEIKNFNGGVGDIADIEYTRDGLILVTGRSNTAKLFDAAGKQQAEFKGLPDDAMRVAYDHEGERVLAGDWSGRVFIWKKDGTKLGELKTNEPGATTLLTSVKQSIDQQTKARDQLAAEVNKLNAELAKRAKAASDAKAAMDQAKKTLDGVNQQVAERDKALNEGKSKVAAMQKTVAGAKSDEGAAAKAMESANAAAAQLAKARDEAKKAVEASAENEELKALAEKSLAAAAATLDKANKQAAESKKAFDEAKAAVAEATKQLAAANAELAKRVEMRIQLNEKIEAANKQFAAWSATYAKASPMAKPNDAEAKKLKDLNDRVAKINAELKPLIDRQSNLAKVLALGK